MGEIEEGVPPPQDIAHRPLTLAGVRAREMKIGSSIVCDDLQEKNKLRAAMHYLGYKYIAAPEGVIGYRVWRIS